MIRTTTTRGQMLVQVIVFAGIAAYLISAFGSFAALNIKASRQAFSREQAIQIAEAGIDYYRWRLAHAPTDYQNNPGPITRDFYDKDGNMLGSYTLNITPPPLGSTLVTASSTGSVAGNPSSARTITTRLGKPSIAKYAVAANAAMRFGSGTEVFGPIHSNQGIRFDALAHNVVTSAVASYDDPDHSGGNEFGVHTHVAPTDPPPPFPVPSRPDVFEAGRQFPVPAVDFAGITADLAQMKSAAQTSGFYRAASGGLAYHVVVLSNDTFNLYRVTSWRSFGGCTNVAGQSGWGTWSIQNQTLLGNYAFPANGIMFFEDHVVVDGQINGARLTIVAAYLPDNPASRKNIIVNNDLLYTLYDGSDSIGLIAQNNFNVGLVSDNDLRIDGALIAQNGRVGRHYYSSSCSSYYVRTTLTLWGMIATNQRYGFAYTDGTGYQNRYLNYDGNLLYGPPPNFPLTSDQYVTVSWEEE